MGIEEKICPFLAVAGEAHGSCKANCALYVPKADRCSLRILGDKAFTDLVNRQRDSGWHD